ncbi:MAG: hypothetical protein IPM74_09165 [Crocinitomicaceae bacterium]|nr:hypothetical protein [Crocinitomicaceae bacterium]
MGKLLVSIIFVLSMSNSFGQDYSYSFKIDGVVDLSTAKEITDPLRELFKTYPTFIVDTQKFDFISGYEYTEEDLSSYLIEYGYYLTEFSVLVIE